MASCVVQYVDDLLISSPDRQTHMKDLEVILRHLADSGMRDTRIIVALRKSPWTFHWCPSHCPAGSCEGPSRPAMLILSCSSKLRLLEGMLRRGLPDTLPVYGAVMHVNRGNPAGQEVLVDSWPEFKTVLTRPRREVRPLLGQSHSASLPSMGSTGESIIHYLCLLIRHFPNACLLAPEGTPISWCLTDPLAALINGYTLPEHHGQHHMRPVVGTLAAQLHARGFPVYTGVLPHNEPSLHTLQRLGFRILPGLFYQLMVRPGFTQSQSASALASAQDPAPSSGERPHTHST
ncbi:glycine N-acyltransferase-like protein 3 [Emys orbicularis]|uniref:glycine N-acyltransferase-like protein 3 n=1 Tax=Emys orbicularis TaxID=82168 RepID=UPI0031FBDA6C